MFAGRHQEVYGNTMEIIITLDNNNTLITKLLIFLLMTKIVFSSNLNWKYQDKQKTMAQNML